MRNSLMKPFLLCLCLVLALSFARASSFGESSVYQIGDTMEDFTVTLADGSEVSLSGLLAEKKMVLINFWASWCGPCRAEFPFMEAAYQNHMDDVGLVALSVEETDTPNVIAQFKEDYQLPSLPMGQDNGLKSRFRFDGIPTSVVVDRFGTICMIHIGSTDAFEQLFSLFTAQDYTESLLLPDGIPGRQYAGDLPTSQELSAALNGEGASLVFSCSTDQYAWPFLPAREGGVVSTNGGEDNTRCCASTTISARAGDVLAFDLRVSSEFGYDVFALTMNGETMKVFSGEVDWQTVYVPVAGEGEIEVSFSFSKDEAEAEGEDLAAFRNVRLLTGDEAAKIVASLPKIPQTLEGREMRLTVENEGAREVVIHDPSGLWEIFFSDTPVYVVGSQEATMKAVIGRDINPEFCAVLDAHYSSYPLLEGTCDEEGVLIRLPLYSVADDGNGYNFVLLVSNLYDDSSNVIYQLLFVNEEDINLFITDVLGLEGVSWMYADGSLPSLDETALPAVADDIPEGYARYRVMVTDQEGNGVSGALAQICDDSTCEVLTSEEGLIQFTRPRYPYEIHLLSVPDIYNPVTEVFSMPDDGTLNIVLTRK